MQNLVNRADSIATQVIAKLALDRFFVLGILAAYVLPLVGITTFTGDIGNAIILAALLAYGSLVCVLPLAVTLLAIDGILKLLGSTRRTYDFHIGSLDMATINLIIGMALTLTAASLVPFTTFHLHGVAIVSLALFFSFLIEWMNGKVRPNNHHTR